MFEAREQVCLCNCALNSALSLSRWVCKYQSSLRVPCVFVRQILGDWERFVARLLVAGQRVVCLSLSLSLSLLVSECTNKPE
jgi:hypothetical protein